jgi:hypothetical protein
MIGLPVLGTKAGTVRDQFTQSACVDKRRDSEDVTSSASLDRYDHAVQSGVVTLQPREFAETVEVGF